VAALTRGRQPPAGCHSERSEESLLSLSSGRALGRDTKDSSLRSE
jgi:hypothetical protein